ncbi:hypothetical protein O6072_20305 [Mycolicibacterium neoaurum]|uniref:hypothetical protein n=1 Tax=Mycolicibacterium neoaurum TaxID=1795 RepID=UPI00248BA0C3|nr:hypothetical protein [Mycolicibacterium neoaurum]WBP94048.1 hypothetical protein O7W24_23450 [Mycolicibacterium neoaurum]WBS07186.1 hypothetical protein O6072_20305 [Mycolicibacterium neoaurum]
MRYNAAKAAVIAPILAIGLTGCVPEEVTASSTGSPASGWSSSTTPARPAAAPPTTADFVVGVIVTEQKCFGSAGCNFNYTINPQYISTKPLPEKTTVVYTVTGGDQDQVGNFTIDSNRTATFDRETSISGTGLRRLAGHCHASHSGSVRVPQLVARTERELYVRLGRQTLITAVGTTATAHRKTHVGPRLYPEPRVRSQRCRNVRL